MRSFTAETSRGSSYNAYLILDEDHLIDTVKEPFRKSSSGASPPSSTLLRSTTSSPTTSEPDHSGSTSLMMALPERQGHHKRPQRASEPQGALRRPVVRGRQGRRHALSRQTHARFVPTPMLHTIDSMVTYCPEEKILFSGNLRQHLASGGNHFMTRERPRRALLRGQEVLRQHPRSTAVRHWLPSRRSGASTSR